MEFLPLNTQKQNFWANVIKARNDKLGPKFGYLLGEATAVIFPYSNQN